MKSKSILIIIVVIMATLIVFKVRNDFAERNAFEQSRSIIRQQLASLLTKWKADSKWDKYIRQNTQSEVAFCKLSMSKLREVWLAGNPIMFAGNIEEISALDSVNNRVLIRRGIVTNPSYVFDEELILRIAVNNSMIDTFITHHPDVVSEFSLLDGVVAIVTIEDILDSIEFRQSDNEKYEKIEVVIGDAKLLDILYIGDYSFSHAENAEIEVLQLLAGSNTIIGKQDSIEAENEAKRLLGEK